MNRAMCHTTVANSVGYGNEFAFAAAFRRTHDLPPGQWRTVHRRTTVREPLDDGSQPGHQPVNEGALHLRGG
jgi:AraC-like DNA-binding protein